jgi:Fe2+ or Zn2+ uptake regulation protein
MLDLLAKDDCHWQKIVEEVSKTYQVSNWMSIRSVLQALKNAGVLTRFPDISIEKYVRP